MLKPGIRYNLVDPDQSVPGYLRDNIYYEGGRPSGELKDGRFYYDMIDGSTGQPKYPNSLAGHLDGMEIVRTDGLRYQMEAEND